MKTKIKLLSICTILILCGCVQVTKTDGKFSITRLGGATTFQGASYHYENPQTGEVQTLIIEGYKSDLQSAFEQGAAAALRISGKAVAP